MLSDRVMLLQTFSTPSGIDADARGNQNPNYLTATSLAIVVPFLGCKLDLSPLILGCAFKGKDFGFVNIIT